ncbi:MAG: ArsR family transcriptional regulator, partial [Actinomycetota bacterium]
ARERWWAAAHQMSSFSEADFREDPDDRAAVDWLMAHNLQLTTRWREDWLTGRQGWTEEWVRASDVSDYALELTPAQTRAMNDELAAVIERYRVEGPAEEGDVQQVLVLLDAFPVREVRL